MNEYIHIKQTKENILCTKFVGLAQCAYASLHVCVDNLMYVSQSLID